jgi:hypothetical protein
LPDLEIGIGTKGGLPTGGFFFAGVAFFLRVTIFAVPAAPDFFSAIGLLHGSLFPFLSYETIERQQYSTKDEKELRASKQPAFVDCILK